MEKRTTATSGFTLVEVMVSLAVLGVLLVSVFSITIETYSFVGDTDVDHSTQNEANQAFTRMAEVLRKSGPVNGAGVEYPRVIAGGKEIEFRVLRDLDGNGFPFAAATGELEWSSRIYRIRRDAAGNLRVYDGALPVWHLCRYAEDITFATYREDPSLHLKEIRVSLETRKLTKRGEPLEFTLNGTIDMRN